ncbi:MAG: hypothetical protein ACFCUX_10005 [Candidatus Methylacidiphilales bacterium]
MAGNRIKSTNTLPMARLWKWVAVCALLTGLALVYVFQRVGIHRLSEDVSLLEIRLSQERLKADALLLEIQRQKSPEELQHKVSYYGLHMIEITDPSIDVVDATMEFRSMVAERRRAP